MLGAILGVRTELHRLCMDACHRLSKERQRSIGKGSGALGVGRPLTEPPRHCLHVVGCGLDLDHSSVVLLPS